MGDMGDLWEAARAQRGAQLSKRYDRNMAAAESTFDQSVGTAESLGMTLERDGEKSERYWLTKPGPRPAKFVVYPGLRSYAQAIGKKLIVRPLIDDKNPDWLGEFVRAVSQASRNRGDHLLPVEAGRKTT